MLINGAINTGGSRVGVAMPFQSRGLGAIADNGEQSPLDQITSTISDLVTVYNQQKILEANIERQKMGLPPIDTSAIAPTYNVGLSPDTKNMLMLGGALLLVVLLLRGGRK